MALRARALYDFRSENPGEISLREHEVLSLCSEQDIEGWLEGVNSRGDRGLFPASYVQVIRAPAAEPPPPARYANVPVGGFEPLPPPVAFKPAAQQQPPPEPFPPPSAGYPFPPYGGSYQPSQGSDDDWDDDWDDSSTVADEPGALGSSYPEYEAAAGGGPGRYRLSTRSEPALGPRGAGHPPGHPHPPGGGGAAKSSATVSRNLNRFSTFVKSGGEAFVLGEASGFVKDGDKLCVVLGPRGPEWQENPYPFQCSIEDPTKQTKFKGMKSYIAYKLVPSHTGQQVHRRYKHFDWLYGRLAEKFPVISVPHLPEKQATGRFEEDFISKRRKGLAWWMDHMCSHPVLAQCDAFQHFLTCPSTDEKAWKQGKRKAEKDEMVGANFFLTISVPTGPGASLDLQEVESQVDGFKAFTKKMDESALQLNHTANEFARKQVTGFKKEYQKVGHSFKCLSQAFELDQQAFSSGLNQAIAFTAEAYDAIGDLFADQPRQDLDPVMDLLALYQGHLANFPDIIHVQKGLCVDIIGGREVAPHSRPFMAQIWGSKFWCGGALIKQNWVLTAAHCQTKKGKVVLGAHSLEKHGEQIQTFRIVKQIPYPCYNDKSKENDIMLVQLDKRATLNAAVKLIPLPASDDDPKPGTICTVAGWGQTDNRLKEPSPTLREVNITVISRQVCNDKRHYNGKPVITENMICAGDKKGKKDSCAGDSGGPLRCNNVMRGVTSFGKSKCGRADGPGVYTRLTKQYLQWIRTTIGGA